jgi:hypothetical protein
MKSRMRNRDDLNESIRIRMGAGFLKWVSDWAVSLAPRCFLGSNSCEHMQHGDRSHKLIIIKDD